MHAVVLNELHLALRLRPRTPLLIKSGGDASILEPVLADMQFVRIQRDGEVQPFIPGSSLRGPLRAHAEKLVRSVDLAQACSIVSTGGRPASPLRKSCASSGGGGDPADVYRSSCYVCRLFGSTQLASRVRFSDLFMDRENPVLLETRAGVAIDRVTGAVGVGPFDMEVASDGVFAGTVTLRNFTLGQLGLLAAAFLDMQEGVVSLGYGKSRGLGRVSLSFSGSLRMMGPRAVGLGSDVLAGVQKLADARTRTRYFASDQGEQTAKLPFSFQKSSLGLRAELDHEEVTKLFEQVAPLWVKEVESGAG